MLEPTNRIGLGSQTIGNQTSAMAKKGNKEASETQQQTQAQQQNVQNFNEKDFFNALSFVSQQNMVQINRPEAQAVNPSDYLSEERISDIEAMMAEFDSGVSGISNTIEAEFPGVFDEASKNALAARIFAGE